MPLQEGSCCQEKNWNLEVDLMKRIHVVSFWWLVLAALAAHPVEAVKELISALDLHTVPWSQIPGRGRVPKCLN